MSAPSGLQPSWLDQQLDRAYQRVLHAAVGLGVLAVLASALLVSWRSSVGVALGALIALLNFAWLHEGAEMMVRRMLAPGENAASAVDGAAHPSVPSTANVSGVVQTGPSTAGQTGPSAAVQNRPSTTEQGPSKLRMALFFPLRYLVVIAAIYVIVKGYPGVLVSFLVGLVLPTLALMGEGIYEAVVLQRERPPLQ